MPCYHQATSTTKTTTKIIAKTTTTEKEMFLTVVYNRYSETKSITSDNGADYG